MARKILIWLIFGGMAILLIVCFVKKDSVNRYISKMMTQEISPDIELYGKYVVDSLYNYTKNGKPYEFTLLEFGSTGCVLCKKMEPVLEEIRNSDKINANVAFIYIMKPENLPLMKYYGISAVPMQIMLDKQGKEFFRNYGYISADDLIAKTVQNNSSQL